MPSLGVYEWIVAVPGLLALLGVAVGYGTLRQKVKTLEDQMQHLSLLSESVVRIDERTQHSAQGLIEVKDSVQAIGNKMDGFLQVLVGEARSFRDATDRARGRTVRP